MLCAKAQKTSRRAATAREAGSGRRPEVDDELQVGHAVPVIHFGPEKRMIQGALIGIIGTLIGVVGGVLLALNVETVVPAIERTLHIQFLDKSVYYISDLPSDLQSADVITIASIALVLALVATLYPSFRASRVNPAEALRYE